MESRATHRGTMTGLAGAGGEKGQESLGTWPGSLGVDHVALLRETTSLQRRRERVRGLEVAPAEGDHRWTQGTGSQRTQSTCEGCDTGVDRDLGTDVAEDAGLIPCKDPDGDDFLEKPPYQLRAKQSSEESQVRLLSAFCRCLEFLLSKVLGNEAPGLPTLPGAWLSLCTDTSSAHCLSQEAWWAGTGMARSSLRTV